MCLWMLSCDIVERVLIVEISVSGAGIAPAGGGTSSYITEGTGRGPCLAGLHTYLTECQSNHRGIFVADS